MIVVIGSPVASLDAAGAARPGGLAAGVAMAAVRAGGRVQLVGKVGDDTIGDALLLALAAAGVEHVALQRDPSHRTPTTAGGAATDGPSPLDDPDLAPAPAPGLALDAADADLALRYLTELSTVVVAEPTADAVLDSVAAAASYAGAGLLVVMGAGTLPPAGLPETAVVLQPPADGDPDGAFATFVGGLAAAMDRGVAPADAFRDLGAALGVVPLAEP